MALKEDAEKTEFYIKKDLTAQRYNQAQAMRCPYAKLEMYEKFDNV